MYFEINTKSDCSMENIDVDTAIMANMNGSILENFLTGTSTGFPNNMTNATGTRVYRACSSSSCRTGSTCRRGSTREILFFIVANSSAPSQVGE